MSRRVVTCAVSFQVYVCGGIDEQNKASMNVCQMYDPTAAKWSETTKVLNYALPGLAIVLNSKLKPA